MGSSRPRNSTRAAKALSVRTSPKPQHKPTSAPEPPRGAPALSLDAMAARLGTRKRTTDLGTAAVDALRAARDGVPAAGALRQVRDRLEIARAATYVAAATLRAQRADYDVDVALVLQRCVGDELDRQVERIGILLKGVAP